MSDLIRALLIGMAGAILLCIVLTIAGVSYFPMLIACEVVLVGLYGLFYWKPTVIRDVLSKLMKRVRHRA